MSKIAYLNSKYIDFSKAKVHIEDRGLQFSDSVYEVVPFYNKKLIDFNFHVKRLKYSLKELQIKYIVKEDKLKKIFNKIITLNKLKNGIVYLQITRGVQSRDHDYKKNLIPNLIIYTINRKLNLPNKNFKGEKAIIYKDLRWKRRDIKTVSLLANVLAKKEAVRKKAYEAILIDNGKITEATASNVWIVKNNKLITHPANTDILKGITRESIKRIIKSNKLQLRERSFTVKELYSADEVFITSSGNLLTPIIKIDSRIINKGKIGKISFQLATLYADYFINE
jgi:D-alanine transaminase